MLSRWSETSALAPRGILSILYALLGKGEAACGDGGSRLITMN